jgi:MoaA/NifB/PqqE/SkfB family radical SAM enzyme
VNDIDVSGGVNLYAKSEKTKSYALDLDAKKFEPNQLLIQRKTVENYANDLVHGNKNFTWFLTFLGITISIITAGTPLLIGRQVEDNWVYVIVSILIASVFVTIFFGVRSQSMESEKVMEHLVNEAIDESSYTIIYLITKMDMKKNMLFILTENDERAYLPHVDLGGEFKGIFINLNNAKHYDTLKEYLSKTLDVDIDLITSLGHFNRDNPEHNIKQSNKRTMPTFIRYEYINVKLSNKCIAKLDNSSKFRWREQSDLFLDLKAAAFNSDVLEYLRAVDKSVKLKSTISFQEDYEPLKIIWNITNKCNYNCNICATHSTRTILDENSMHFVYLRLKDAKYRILSLDFSGGDPLCDTNSKKIISCAINDFGKDNVSVTTTGKSINGLTDTERNELLHNIEITLDLNGCDIGRCENDYVELNNAAINRHASHIDNLSINIPILNCNASSDDITKIINYIDNFQVQKKTANLLRYMPVGRADLNDGYNPKKVIKELRSRLTNVDVHIHCALRGAMDNEENNCSMCAKKIGIDCAGNVFACAWAGYIKEFESDIQNNPFYLGNLTQETLDTILSKNESIMFVNKLEKNKGHCCIFSFLKNTNKDAGSALNKEHHQLINQVFSFQDPLMEVGTTNA